MTTVTMPLKDFDELRAAAKELEDYKKLFRVKPRFPSMFDTAPGLRDDIVKVLEIDRSLLRKTLALNIDEIQIVDKF